MTHTFRIISSGFLAISMVLGLVPVALAHETTVTFLPSGFSAWNTSGSPTVLSDRVTIEGSQREWVWIDLDARSIDDNFIAVAAYADKVDSRSSMATNNRARSGNPYIYAYLIDQNGKIQRYLTGDSTMATTRTDADNIVYGIFPNVRGTKTIRVFLKQSSVRGISNSGADATFMRPMLAETSSASRGRDLVAAYANQNLTLSYQGATIPNSGTTSTNPPTTPPITPPTVPPTTPPVQDLCSAGTPTIRATFEPGVSIDSRLRFGGLNPGWTMTGSHNYPSMRVDSNYVTTGSAYEGSGKLGGLSNPFYGYDARTGTENASPALYDEAVGVDITSIFAEGQRYRFSMRARVVDPLGANRTANLMLAKEHQYTSQMAGMSGYQTYDVGSDWRCLTLDISQPYRNISPTTQLTADNFTLYFGSMTRTQQLFIDDLRVTPL